jgi:hypothetical protein
LPKADQENSFFAFAWKSVTTDCVKVSGAGAMGEATPRAAKDPAAVAL